MNKNNTVKIGNTKIVSVEDLRVQSLCDKMIGYRSRPKLTVDEIIDEWETSTGEGDCHIARLGDCLTIDNTRPECEECIYRRGQRFCSCFPKPQGVKFIQITTGYGFDHTRLAHFVRRTTYEPVLWGVLGHTRVDLLALHRQYWFYADPSRGGLLSPEACFTRALNHLPDQNGCVFDQLRQLDTVLERDFAAGKIPLIDSSKF